MRRNLAFAGAVFGVLFASVTVGADRGDDSTDLFSRDVARYRRELSSKLPAVRVAGVQGLSYLRHHSFEPDLIAVFDDNDVAVRREAVLAIARLGRRASVIPLIARLGDKAYEVRTHAANALVRVTGHQPEASSAADGSYWRRWWEQMTADERESSLIAALKDPATRTSALKTLRRLGGARTEKALIDLANNTKLTGSETRLLLEALEPVATGKSLPLLDRLGRGSHATAWALGNIGGVEAMRILVKHRPAFGLDGLINLDRLHWTGAFPLTPELVRSFGLVSYRGLPDDLHNPPTPRQRLSAQLLLRSRRAAEIVDVILSKLDGKATTVAKQDDPTIQALVKLVEAMSEELKPGFHRADSDTKAIPLCAMAHLVRDSRLTPRLIKLLAHPAYVVRVYAAQALATLRASEAVGPIVEILRSGYAFDDATHQVSGKHGHEISRFVRWKGYLAMALGRIGGDPAREALETLVADPATPRDIRMGAAVGLGIIADPRSRGPLTRAVEKDLVRWIRKTARRSLDEIDINAHAGNGGP